MHHLETTTKQHGLNKWNVRNKKIIEEYILMLPSTSSSPLVCPPFVHAWYIPMSSSVASWMISVCFFPSFLKRYFEESLSLWSSISSKNLWKEKDWACLKHVSATWTQRQQEYQETHQIIHIKNATEQCRKETCSLQMQILPSDWLGEANVLLKTWTNHQ